MVVASTIKKQPRKVRKFKLGIHRDAHRRKSVIIPLSRISRHAPKSSVHLLVDLEIWEESEGINREKVRGHDLLPMMAQELFPGRSSFAANGDLMSKSDNLQLHVALSLEMHRNDDRKENGTSSMAVEG